jgi:hypothetical protein
VYNNPLEAKKARTAEKMVSQGSTLDSVSYMNKQMNLRLNEIVY